MGEEGSVGVKRSFQEWRLTGTISSNLCSKIGMYNGMADGWMGVLGVLERGTVKRWCRGQTMERLVEHLTEFRFYPWGIENLSIFSRVGSTI